MGAAQIPSLRAALDIKTEASKRSERNIIPKDADKFILSWYSVAEKTYYEDEYDFKFERFPLQAKIEYRSETPLLEQVFPSLTQKTIGFFTLRLKINGDTDLLYRDGNYDSFVAFNFTKILTKDIPAELERSLKEREALILNANPFLTEERGFNSQVQRGGNA